MHVILTKTAIRQTYKIAPFLGTSLAVITAVAYASAATALCVRMIRVPWKNAISITVIKCNVLTNGDLRRLPSFSLYYSPPLVLLTSTLARKF